MKFIEVSEIPERKDYDGRPKKPVRKFIECFLLSDIRIARVILEDEDYARPEYARLSLNEACKRYGYPVEVKTRSGDIYLVRKE